MTSRARLLVLGLLVPSCFAPDAPAGTDGGDADGMASSGGLTGTSTMPTTGSTQGSSGGPTTGNEDTDPSDTTPTGTDPTDSPPTGTGSAGSDTGGSTVCGDGAVEGDEVCDDGVNDGSYGGCESDCSSFGSFCGDGTQDGPEDCDDGDAVEGNGCNNDCVPSGLELWTNEEHQTPSDECVAIVPSGSDHVYVAARVDNLEGGAFAGSFFTQRLSASGSVDWEREHAPLATPTQHDYRTYVAADAGDGVVVFGAHRSNSTQSPLSANYTDVHSVKLSAANGDVVWSRSDGGPALPLSVAVDDGGEFAVAAITSDDFNSYIFRVSEGGDAIGGPDITVAGAVSSIAFDPAGSFVVAMNPAEAVIQRRNAGFGVLWEADVSPLADTLAITVGEGGDIFAVGEGFDGGFGRWIGRRSSGNGAEVWTVLTADVAALGRPVSITATPEGDIVVAGDRDDAPWLARLDSAGEVLWSRSAGESGAFASVGVRADGSVVACGTVDGGGQGDNIFVAAYTP